MNAEQVCRGVRGMRVGNERSFEVGYTLSESDLAHLATRMSIDHKGSFSVTQEDDNTLKICCSDPNKTTGGLF